VNREFITLRTRQVTSVAACPSALVASFISKVLYDWSAIALESDILSFFISKKKNKTDNSFFFNLWQEPYRII